MVLERYTIPSIVLFSDFDDTIIDTDTYVIQTETSSFLHKHKKDVGLIVVTSRGWDGLKPYVSKLNLYLPQIVENGAMIIDPRTEEVIFKTSLSSDSVKNIYKIIIDNSLETSFSAGNDSYADKHKLLQVRNIGRISIIAPQEKAENILSLISSIPDISYVYGHGMKVGGSGLIDITPKDITKSAGVKKWVEIIGANYAKAYVIGNNESDLPMYNRTTVPGDVTYVAVENAIQEIKSKSDIITLSSKENGFYKLLSSIIKEK